MATEGVVVNVTEHIAGSELSANVSAGASSITVYDGEEFDQDGGQFTIGSEAPHTYTADGNTLTLVGSTLASGYSQDQPVYLYPETVERFAYVVEPGGDDALEARVPHSLYGLLPVGSRNPDDGTAEVVEVGYVGTELVVTDVVGKAWGTITPDGVDMRMPDPTTHKIRWLRNSDGALAVVVEASEQGSSNSALSLRVFNQDNEPVETAFTAMSGTSGGFVLSTYDGVTPYTKTLLAANGDSDFELDVSDGWQNWTPTLSGWSADPTNAVYRYKQIGKVVIATIAQGSAGTSNAATKTITLPVTAANVTNHVWEETARIVDNGVTLTSPGFGRIVSGGTSIAFGKDSSAVGGFTASGSHRIIACTITYEAA